jgi:DNA-directed RNA polymerase subunit beta
MADKRQYWGKTDLPLPELDLVAVQKNSYEDFLKNGIGESFKEINPIEDFTGKNWKLEFSDYKFGQPKHTPAIAKEKGLTYEIPL